MWEILNFSVLAAVSITCLPSDNSRRLTYASQLPTDDPGSSLIYSILFDVIVCYDICSYCMLCYFYLFCAMLF